MTSGPHYKIIDPIKGTANFQSLAVAEGFSRKYRDYPALRIGVDVSIWIAACEAGARAGSLHSMDENAPLKIFFYRLCRLLSIPATFIFVFDGPDRPPHKRGVSVINRPLWVTAHLKPLVEDFGFYHHQAPGEAEAELAELNRRMYIDAILTEDSDAIVFGGLNILRCLPNADHYNEVHIYHHDMIHHSDEVRLSRGGLILYALCAGGDYSDGLHDCGPETAFAIARLDFGDRLLHAFEALGEGPELDSFLVAWRIELQDLLRNNPCHDIPRRRPSLADSITGDFPNLRVLALYQSPMTSWSTAAPTTPDTFTWIPHLPRPAALARFCCKRFGWNPTVIVKRFHKHVWRGLAIRMFTFPLTLYNPSTMSLVSPFITARVVKLGGVIPAGTGRLLAVKVRLSTQGFIDALGGQWASYRASSQPVSLEIPDLIINAVVPSISVAAATTSLLTNASASTVGTSENPIQITDDEADELEVGHLVYIPNGDVVDLTLD